MFNHDAFPRTRTSLIQALGGKPDSSIWREFFNCYAPAVYRIGILRGLQTIDAEDIVQDVMLAIAKQMTSFEYSRDRGRFRDWVRRITDNKIISLWRHKQAEQALTRKMQQQLNLDPSAVDQFWNDQWELQDLEYCLTRISDRISPKRLAAFRMYVLEGATAAETAVRMQIQIGYVYVIRNQILNLIKIEMQRLDESEDSAS